MATRLLRERGLTALLRHCHVVAGVRAHYLLFDRQLERRLPRRLIRPAALSELSLRTSIDNEAEGVGPSSAAPSRLIKWAVEGLGVEPSRYTFVDVGSGHGYVLIVAAACPFRRVVGIEFAGELHEQAVENVAWARGNLRLAAPEIELRHESALAMDLPREPLILYLFNEFGTAVLDRFLDRVEESARACPRDILLLYAKPLYADCFQRPAFEPLRLRRRQAALIKLFSPFKVLAYRCRTDRSTT